MIVHIYRALDRWEAERERRQGVIVYIGQRKKGMFTIFDNVCCLILPERISACGELKLEMEG